MSAPLRWLVLDEAALPGAMNMARDHTLAEWCPPGVALLRYYTWARPTLSLGRNEPARDIYDPAVLEVRGVDVVRRPTGGRSVLHHRELTYSVVAPLRSLGTPRQVYRLVNQGLARGLTGLGAPVVVSDEGVVAPLDAGACFQSPAPGEVVATGRKLVGSAQVRLGDVLLQHGSILLENDQDLLSELRREVPSSRPATLHGLLEAVPDPRELREAVTRGMQEVVPGDWRAASRGDSFGGPEPPVGVSPRYLDRYSSPEWTWRR